MDRELSGKPIYTLDDEQVIFELEMAAYEREQTMDAFRASVEVVPGRVVPPGSVMVHGLSGDVVYCYDVPFVTKKGRPGVSLYAKAFHAGAVKHAWHTVFRTVQERQDRINEFFSDNAEALL